MKLVLLPDELAVCELDACLDLPTWCDGELVCLINEADHATVLCRQELVPSDVRCEKDWRAFRVHGVLEFSEVGIIADLTQALAAAGVPVFVLSTFRTDYVLVRANQVMTACQTLERAGHTIQQD